MSVIILPFVETDDNNPEAPEVRSCVMYDDDCVSEEEVCDALENGKDLGDYVFRYTEKQLIEFLTQSKYISQLQGQVIQSSVKDIIEELYNPPEEEEEVVEESESEEIVPNFNMSGNLADFAPLSMPDGDDGCIDDESTEDSQDSTEENN